MAKITVKTIPQRGTRVRGIARVTIEGITIYPFRIMDSKSGLFVGMPQNQRNDSTWVDLFHPITTEARKFLMDCILDTFQDPKRSEKDFSFPHEFSPSASVTPVTNGASECIGVANLDLCNAFRIENIRICLSSNNEPVLFFPLRTWQTRLGEIKSSRVVEVSDELQIVIRSVVIAEYEEELERQGANLSKKVNHFCGYEQRDYKEDMGGNLEALQEQRRRAHIRPNS